MKCSTLFRRLQDKAQVFPLDEDDYVRTRLTHSLEVSAIGKKLGEYVFRRLKKENKGIPGSWRIQRRNFQMFFCVPALFMISVIHHLDTSGNIPFGNGSRIIFILFRLEIVQ